jgi:hypothetical protein
MAGYLDLLLDLKEVKDELNDLDFKIAREIEREIIEGEFHNGLGSVFQTPVLKSKFYIFSIEDFKVSRFRKYCDPNFPRKNI